MRASRPVRAGALALTTLTAGALVATGTALAAPASAAPAAARSATALGVVPGWRTPASSRWAAPSAVTGRVGAGQHVRVVRLADIGGRPQITVAEAVGPAAAAQTVQQAQAAPGTVAVSLDVRRTALTTGTDPLRSRQWALTKLGAESAWQRTTGAGVTVAVVDTGVAAVPDLAGRLLPGVDYVNGYGNGTDDEYGHGTHVAGIIAATAGNGVGIAGLAPGARILPVRVLDASGGGYDSDVASGIVYAADHGASVINLSLGGPGYSAVLARAVSYAQSRDVVVVAAAGNGRLEGNETSYPAAFPGVLAVAATDSGNAVASFSNSGPYVGVAAPGVDILSTVPGGYSYESGTSMASPYAAATAALVRAANRNLRAADVVADVRDTATDLAPTGADYRSGHGLVSPRRAICAVSACPAADRFDLQPVPVRVTAGTAVTLKAQLRSAGGAAIAGARTQWCFAPTGAAAHCAAATTDASGWASYRLVPQQSGAVYATFAGTSAWNPATTSKPVLTVVPGVAVRLAKGTVAVSVSPAAREPVQLQRQAAGTWQVVRNVTTDTSGRVTWSGLASGATVRVVVPAYGGRAAATTSSYRIP